MHLHRPDHRTVAAAAAYILSAAFCCAPLVAQAHLVDLQVYRMGGAAVLHGGSLYQLRFAGQLPFTYPPFAALLFAGLAWLPWVPAAAAMTALTVAALPVMLYLALRLQPASSSGQLASSSGQLASSSGQLASSSGQLASSSGQPAPPLRSRQAAWQLALAASAAGIWLEPVHSTVFYGQVDVLIAAAVLYDLNLPRTSPVKGAAIGLATALKLTPAIFVVYLLLTRQYRAAATATAVFAASVALGFAVLPGASVHFWDISFLRPGRVSPPQNTQNQSLLGALSRTLHTADVGLLWLLLATVVVLTGLALAVRAAGRGDQARGFSLCAVTGLLISPISWTHHWVLAVPILLLAILAIGRPRTRHRLPAAAVTAIAVTAIAVIGWAQVARHVPNTGWLRLTASATIKSEVYVIIGLGVLVAAVAAELIEYARSRPGTKGQTNGLTNGLTKSQTTTKGKEASNPGVTRPEPLRR